MNPHEHAGHPGSEPETIHRWVVFGSDPVYLSHLSMFAMPEHAIQLIVTATFAESDGSPSTAYRDDLQAHPNQRLYTLDPAVFVLSDVLPTDSQPPRQTTLQADLFRNHVEQPPTKPEMIASGIEVRLSSVVLAHRYDAGTAPLGKLEYVLFGDEKASYLAHFITRPPDFDQILRVRLDQDVPADELAAGIRLTVPDRANDRGVKIEEDGGPVSAILHRAAGDTTVTVTPEFQFYFNFDGDMSRPPRPH